MLFSLSHIFEIYIQDYLINCKILAAALKICDMDFNKWTNISGAQWKSLAGQHGKVMTFEFQNIRRVSPPQ